MECAQYVAFMNGMCSCAGFMSGVWSMCGFYEWSVLSVQVL